MAARIWSNNSDTTLTCWRITNFNFSLHPSLLWFVFVFLPFKLDFLFTRDYYNSTRFEIFSSRNEMFYIIAIFFNSVYRVEISTQDENLHIISLLVAMIQTSGIIWMECRRTDHLYRSCFNDSIVNFLLTESGPLHSVVVSQGTSNQNINCSRFE